MNLQIMEAEHGKFKLRIAELERQLAKVTRERDDFEQARDIFERLNANHWQQLAASQAREQQLLDACRKGYLQLIHKVGGTYKEGYGGSCRDAEAAMLMYEALATKPDYTALQILPIQQNVIPTGIRGMIVLPTNNLG